MIKNVMAVVMTLAIPFFLFLTVWQTGRYAEIDSELRSLDMEQQALVNQNKRLISALTVLSVPERIERVATEELYMRKARSDEIMRIELKREGLGG